MRPLFLFIGLFSALGLFGQPVTEEARYRKVAEAFKTAYNAGDYVRVFGMFDSIMQVSLPLEKTRDVLGNQVRAGSGNIREMDYYRRQGTAHVYKTRFDQGVLDIILSLDNQDRINGLYLKPHVPMDTGVAEVLERNATHMKLPFRGEWFVFWGGEQEQQNYHMANVHQQFAYDLLQVADGASYRGDPLKNESYFAFGQDILAPCDGTVVLAIDGVPDNTPGEMNNIHLTGNTLVIRTEKGEFILMAHLREGTLAVRKGQRVHQGDLLAQCGNSGNSSEPHLHLQLQNTRDFHKATGARLYFERILVDGEVREDCMPVKENFISNTE